MMESWCQAFVIWHGIGLFRKYGSGKLRMKVSVAENLLDS
jgi:hypothetical protein